MRWHWHIARGNELMVDLDCHDGKDRSGWCMARSSGARGRKVAASLERLKGARDAGLLDVRAAHLLPSKTEWHYHLVVTLGQTMPAETRLNWELRLLDDCYRNLQNRARVTRGHAGSLLITPHLWASYGFNRPRDRICMCTDHSADGMANCPVSLDLRGFDACSHHWGKPTKVSPPLSFGLIDLDR